MTKWDKSRYFNIYPGVQTPIFVLEKMENRRIPLKGIKVREKKSPSRKKVENFSNLTF